VTAKGHLVTAAHPSIEIRNAKKLNDFGEMGGVTNVRGNSAGHGCSSYSQQIAGNWFRRAPQLPPLARTHRKVGVSGKVGVNLSTRKIAPVETIGQGIL
jgi:hypothetical protein